MELTLSPSKTTRALRSAPISGRIRTGVPRIPDRVDLIEPIELGVP